MIYSTMYVVCSVPMYLQYCLQLCTMLTNGVFVCYK